MGIGGGGTLELEKVAARRGPGMLVPETSLQDHQGSGAGGAGGGLAPGPVVYRGEVVQGQANVRMGRPEDPALEAHGPFEQGDGLGGPVSIRV